MKSVFLDDTRVTPAGFDLRTFSVRETIEAINEAGKIGLLSLDNDLGDYHHDGGDGFAVVNWLCERSFAGGVDLWPERLALHTSNSVERDQMIVAAMRHGGYRTRRNFAYATGIEGVMLLNRAPA